MNRQSRRAVFGAVPAVAVGLGALTIAGCASTIASVTNAATSGAMTAIIARAQAIVTILTSAATLLGANLTTDAQAAIAKVVSAATAIGSVVGNGAAAVANATISSGFTGLVTSGGGILIKLLALVPGLGTVAGLVSDAITVAPSLIVFVQSIINPTAVSAAPSDGGAARRLGIIA